MNAWIHIDTYGKVTLTDHRAEMGQGSYQSVPQIIAEELEVDLADVSVIFAQGSQSTYGSQITGGSSTISSSYKNLLKLSATAPRNADHRCGSEMERSRRLNVMQNQEM